MLVQGSPNPTQKNFFTYPEVSMPDPELSPDDRLDRLEEKVLRAKQKTRWSFSSLLLWNCPEYFESFSH